MREDAQPACFTIHSLDQLRVVLAAAEGRPVIALSGPIASAYAGAGWFAALVSDARAEFPDANLTAMLDCGDRAGDVLSACKLGLTDIVFTGHPDAARRLAQIADATGAHILRERPASKDLLNVRDPTYAVRTYFESGSR